MRQGRPTGAAPVSSDDGADPSVRRRRRRVTVWLVAFLSYLALVCAWVLATPLSASPDEPEHVHRAAAVVRGELLGQQPDTGLRVYVTPPQGVVSPSKRALCYAFQPEVTADCAEPLQGSSERVQVRSGAGLYNPAYYAVVGLPSLPLPSEIGIYLMRLLSGAVCAGFLASALASAVSWRRSRLLVLGLLATITPMVIFLSATVNPSGVEIAASISLWTSGLVLAVSPVGTALTPVVLRRCALAAMSLVVTRQLSPLWLALIAIVLLSVAGRHRLRALVARRDTTVWALLVLIVTLFSVGWTILAGSLGQGYPDTPERSLVDGVKGSILRMPYRTTQMVGIFGWLDTRAPWFTYVAFAAALGLVLLLGLAAARRTGRMLILVTLGLAVTVPLMVEGSQASTFGYIWQGRYTLPLAVGVPLVAMVAAGRTQLLPSALTRPLTYWLAVLVGLGHAGAFAYALLRYQVGVGNGFNLLAGPWSPPSGSWAVLLLFGVALAANLAMIVTLSGEGPARAAVAGRAAQES